MDENSSGSGKERSSKKRRAPSWRRYAGVIGALACAVVCATVIVVAPQITLPSEPLSVSPDSSTVSDIQSPAVAQEQPGSQGEDPQDEGAVLASEPQDESRGPAVSSADNAGERIVKTEDGEDYVGGVALVQVADGADPAQLSEALAQTGLTDNAVVDASDIERGYVEVKLAEGVEEQDAVEAFSDIEGVEGSQRNYVYYLSEQAIEDDAEADADDIDGNASAAAANDDEDVSDAAGAASVGAPDDEAEPEGKILDALKKLWNSIFGKKSKSSTGGGASSASSSDPYRYLETHLDRIHADEAWSVVDSIGVANRSATAAVIDTGINVAHEDLQNGAIVGTYDAYHASKGQAAESPITDVTGHGTHVAGIIGATEGNGVGVAGVSHNKVGILAVKVFNDECRNANGGVYTTSAILNEAYRFVVQNASSYNIRVANMSLGSLRGNSGISSSDRLVVNKVDEAAKQGVLTVCAAGNNNSSDLAWPSDFIDGMGVIALNGNTRASFSNYNAPGSTKKQISAPGYGVYNTYNNGYAALNGTSMASPVVAGVAGLLFATDPTLTVQEVRNAITSTATDLSTPGFDAETGYGEVNAYGAIRSASIGKLTNKKGLPVYDGDFTVVGVEDKTFTGKAITQDVSVLRNATVLTEGKDYRIQYANNVDAGDATMKVVGMGSYANTVVNLPFKIKPVEASIRLSSDPASKGNVVASGWKPVVTTTEGLFTENGVVWPDEKLQFGSYTLQLGKDYTRKCYTTTALSKQWPSKSYAVYQLKGNFSQVAKSQGTESAPITYYQYDPSLLTINNVAKRTYNGAAQIQNPTVAYNGKTLASTNYDVRYDNNVNAGTAKLNIVGKGVLSGMVLGTKAFAIAKVPMSSATVTGVGDVFFDGNPKLQVPTVSVNGKVLVEGTDYTLTYSSRAKSGKAGSAYVTVYGRGNYSGSQRATFNINAYDLSSAVITGVEDAVYDGTQKTPKPVVKVGTKVLTEGVDYSLTYGDNVEPGLGSVTVKNLAKTTDKRVLTFDIQKVDLSRVAIGNITAKTFTGKAFTPSPSLMSGDFALVKDVDYTVSYANNVNAGVATVTFTAKGTHCTGIAKAQFTIQQRKISSASISGRKSSLPYTGKPVVQAITLKYGGNVLVEGKDYKVTYANNIAAGTATMKIAGLGNFTAEKEYTFKIK